MAGSIRNKIGAAASSFFSFIVVYFPLDPRFSLLMMDFCMHYLLELLSLIIIFFPAFYAVLFVDTGGLELFTELLLRFPNNIHILLEMAKVWNSPKEFKFIQYLKTIDAAMLDLLD